MTQFKSIASAVVETAWALGTSMLAGLSFLAEPMTVDGSAIQP
jgi:hypothetical protein